VYETSNKFASCIYSYHSYASVYVSREFLAFGTIIGPSYYLLIIRLPIFVLIVRSTESNLFMIKRSLNVEETHFNNRLSRSRIRSFSAANVRSRGSSGSIVSDYGLNDRAIDRGRFFF
jgi:hypothetical protein